MNYNRNSLLVKSGRIFQDGYRYISFIDLLASIPLILKKTESFPVVCIVAPPRSGSTLTYQILTSSFDNFHLTNVWNLLYSTPLIASYVSDGFCKSYTSKFASENGFVPGACGESEGMRFWEHWSGQGLIEDARSLNESKLSKLNKLLGKVSNDRVFVTGYIGHAFCMNLLRKIFPKIIFIHVTRDLLSNAYSIYQRSVGDWFSLRPKCCQGKSYISAHERVVDQLLGIHDTIICSSEPYDTMRIKYEDLCNRPNGVINNIISFGHQQKIIIQKLPDNQMLQFQAKTISKSLNKDTLIMDGIIQERLLEMSANARGYFDD